MSVWLWVTTDTAAGATTTAKCIRRVFLVNKDKHAFTTCNFTPRCYRDKSECSQLFGYSGARNRYWIHYLTISLKLPSDMHWSPDNLLTCSGGAVGENADIYEWEAWDSFPNSYPSVKIMSEWADMKKQHGILWRIHRDWMGEMMTVLTQDGRKQLKIKN